MIKNMKTVSNIGILVKANMCTSEVLQTLEYAGYWSSWEVVYTCPYSLSDIRVTETMSSERTQ
jgi:hypothetical protein